MIGKGIQINTYGTNLHNTGNTLAIFGKRAKQSKFAILITLQVYLEQRASRVYINHR